MPDKNSDMIFDTLRSYLDRINVGPGDDDGFVIYILGENNEMHVSRRYLESEPWKHVLDKKIINYVYPYIDIYGEKTIKFILE